MDQLSSPSAQLLPFLARIRWRLRLRDGLLLAQRSLWLAVTTALLVLLAGRIFPIETLWMWALVGPGIWLLGIIAFALFRPLPVMWVARLADGELRLKERLSSSLSLDRAKESPVYAAFAPALVAQAHTDALHTARLIEPARDFPLHLERRGLGIALGLLVAAGLLYWLPNPMDSVIAERKAVAKEAQRQAQQVEKLRQTVQDAKEMTPEERAALLKQLAELAKQLKANPGSREQALADLSRLEESLHQKLDPNAGQRQAAMDALAAQMQALAKSPNPQIGDLQAAAEAVKKLADQLKQMTPEERKALAQQLSQMAARAAQVGDGNLAQALAGMSQAAQSGDMAQASQSAQSAAQALSQARSDLANQRAFNQALSQLQSSRQSLAQAGQSGQQAATQQGSGQGQNPGQRQGQGQGQNPGQGQGQNPGQGQSQGQQAGGGGGTNASSLPPANRVGQAGAPRGQGKDTGVSDAASQVYVPREKQAGSGNTLSVPGQDTNQGQTTSKEQNNPLGGSNNPSLVPYNAVYQQYVDAANQAVEQSFVPPGLKDYIRAYFTQLQP